MEANELEYIFEKFYFELSDSEKIEFKDLFSNEEEFNQVKFMLKTLDSSLDSKNITPKSKTKASLDHIFNQTYQHKSILWYNSIGAFFLSSDKNWYQQNLVRMAALLLLILAFFPLWKTNLTESKIQLSKNESPVKVENKVNSDSASSKNDNSRTENNNFVTEKPSFKSKKQTVIEAKTPSLTDGLNDEIMIESGSSFSAHPDGIFSDITLDKSLKNELFDVNKHSDILDLLTPTF